MFTSLVRTGVPAVAGWLVSESWRYGLHLDETAVTGVLTPAAIFAYYAVFRFAEEHLSPRFGWLLGYARPAKRELPAD
ncbi:hypothetical protein [Streptomyces sp. NPDC053367]|uniref:hypothetical protein n=1 Tax=Streptomyces sp. NPDC053367 TaxID=3365700 RepID=UPI0037D7BB61